MGMFNTPDFIDKYNEMIAAAPEHYEDNTKCLKNLHNAAKRKFNKTQEILAKDPEKYTDESGCIDFTALYFDTFPKEKKEYEDRLQQWADWEDETEYETDIISITAAKRAEERAKNEQIANTETDDDTGISEEAWAEYDRKLKEIIGNINSETAPVVETAEINETVNETEKEITEIKEENCEQITKEDLEMLAELQQKLADLEKFINDQAKIIENQNNIIADQNNIIEDLKSEIDQLKNIDREDPPENKPAEITVVAEYIENNKLIEKAEYLGSAERYTGPKEYFKLQTNCEYTGPDLVLEIDKDFLTPVLIAADNIENILDILYSQQDPEIKNWGPVLKTANFG